MRYKIISSGDPWKILLKDKLNFVYKDNYITTSDGSIFKIDNFDNFLKEYNNLKWYRTVIEDIDFKTNESFIIDNYPKEYKEPFYFGTFAIRDKEGFITTTRGKQGSKLTKVLKVDHKNRIVYSKEKATLNAPTLDYIFQKNPKINYLIHTHEKESKGKYCFPGTTSELDLVSQNKENLIINLPHHGKIYGFATKEEVVSFLIEYYNSKIDWDSYLFKFPERYIKNNSLDDYLKEQVFENKEILDIGGGKGTANLENNEVDLLDPFVKKPSHVRKKISFNDNYKYDVIVLRGSFNYLNKNEILKLNNFAKKGKKIVFNTFLNPPSKEWQNRPYKSKEKEGIEYYRLNENIVEHVLDEQKHFFYYYSIKEIEELLFLEILKLKLNNNSLLITGVRK